MLTLSHSLEITVPAPATFVFDSDFAKCVVVVGGNAIPLDVTACAPHTLGDLAGLDASVLAIEEAVVGGAKVFLVKHGAEALASLPDPRP